MGSGEPQLLLPALVSVKACHSPFTFPPFSSFSINPFPSSNLHFLSSFFFVQPSLSILRHHHSTDDTSNLAAPNTDFSPKPRQTQHSLNNVAKRLPSPTRRAPSYQGKC